MDDWKRIGDDEIARFGKRKFEFSWSGGKYSIAIDQSEQNFIEVAFLKEKEQWNLETKYTKDGHFKLCGMAYSVPEILEDVCWYELVVGATVHVTYWGDKVVYRTDRECS